MEASHPILWFGVPLCQYKDWKDQQQHALHFKHIWCGRDKKVKLMHLPKVDCKKVNLLFRIINMKSRGPEG